MRCNVTGRDDGSLYDFYINRDFGYYSEFLSNDIIEFVLHEDEYTEFMAKGNTYDVKKLDSNFTYQYDKEFTSEQIYDLISTFQHPPKGYFSHEYLQYTDEEAQWLWDNQDKDETAILYSDVVTKERSEELKSVFGIK